MKWVQDKTGIKSLIKLKSALSTIWIKSLFFRYTVFIKLLCWCFGGIRSPTPYQSRPHGRSWYSENFRYFWETHLYLLKRFFLLLSGYPGCFLYILHEICMGKMLENLFWANSFWCWYWSNCTKILLDAAVILRLCTSYKNGNYNEKQECYFSCQNFFSAAGFWKYAKMG